MNTRINPQSAGHLQFVDSDLPVFVPVDIGSISDQAIIPIKMGTEVSPVNFPFVSGKYYVSGGVDILASARDGANRKGVFVVGTNATPLLFGTNVSETLYGQGALSFRYLNDAGADPADVQRVYYYHGLNPDPDGSDIYIPSNFYTGGVTPQAMQGRWATDVGFQGTNNLCVNLQDHPQPGQNLANECVDVVVDNTPPSILLKDVAGNVFNNATSSNVIVVEGDVPGSGVYSINLVGVGYSSTNYVSGVQPSASNTFPDSGVLSDGQYVATVTSLSGEVSQIKFFVDTSSPSLSITSRGSQVSSGTLTNQQCLVIPATSTTNGSGINQIWSSTAAIASFPPGTSTAAYAGSLCPISSGTIIVYAKTGAGITTSISVLVSAADSNLTITGSGPNWSASASHLVDNVARANSNFKAHFDWSDCNTFVVKAGGQTLPCVPECGGCAIDYVQDIFGPPSPSFDWVVTNVSMSTFTGHSFSLTGDIEGLGGTITTPDTMLLPAGGSVGGFVSIPEMISTTYTYVLNNSTLTVYSPYSGVVLSTTGSPTPAQASALIRQVLRHSGYEYIQASANGGAAVFDSTMTLNLQYNDSAVDTTTAKIYVFNGVSWDSGAVTSQSLSYASGVVTAIGASTQTGNFAVLYAGQDSSAPVTTLIIQGSSYSFASTTFVSTFSFLVLTATDPVVNGYASTVATITYCLDPSSTSAFSVYLSSIPAPLGTHVLQYRSFDYAGNAEAINTATFTVTAGAALKDSSDDMIAGTFLTGFLGSGAKAEVVARAQDAMTLSISSANRQTMLGVTNIGSVGVGLSVPNGQLDIAPASLALQLRSGNSTSTGTAVQMAFGYNGDVAMRHAIRTYHSTATAGNSMDFLVWTPDAGSTSTLATADFMSLQAITAASGGSMHVLPVGTADVELEVSNGLTTGGGTMQRLQVLTPSSRRFKSDIKYLNEKAEDAALDETAALKHVRFRYRSHAKDGSLYDDPRQEVRVGLIYEDSPESIRGEGQALLDNERLANVELALKAAMRKLEALEKRYQALQARRKSP